MEHSSADGARRGDYQGLYGATTTFITTAIARLLNESEPCGNKQFFNIQHLTVSESYFGSVDIQHERK